MASPLPKTTAPAPMKKTRIFHSTGRVAGPSSPATNQCGGTKSIAVVRNRSQLGGVRISIAATPAARKIQRISFSVQPVTIALTMKMIQSRRSRARVSFTSLVALRAMMAITAAPIP